MYRLVLYIQQPLKIRDLKLWLSGDQICDTRLFDKNKSGVLVNL